MSADTRTEDWSQPYSAVGNVAAALQEQIAGNILKLNGIGGNVVLAAGTGITISSPSGETITISAAPTLCCDVFSPNGTQTTFTLSASPSGKVLGTVQPSGTTIRDGNISVSGTTATLSYAPAVGTDTLEIRYVT
nr:hypothetical protein [uncultured Rhodopila sp.]